MNQEEKYSKRRLQSSYFSTIISIALVLFMLGLLGMIIFQAKRISNHVKENIGISIYLKQDVKEVDIIKLQKSLDATNFVKATKYINKEDAAEMLKKDLGEDFIKFLGYNPLLSSIDLYLKAEYAHPDSVGWIEKELLQNSGIKEVSYQKSLLGLVNKNVQKISFVLLGFSALFLIIAIALINNSIRLTIYSKRFLIRSMQLVGATQGFIRRPFVWKGIVHGIYGAIISILLLIGVLYSAQKEFPALFKMKDLEIFGFLFGAVLLLGIIITWFSTSLAVSKYLRMKTERLY